MSKTQTDGQPEITPGAGSVPAEQKKHPGGASEYKVTAKDEAEEMEEAQKEGAEQREQGGYS